MKGTRRAKPKQHNANKRRGGPVKAHAAQATIPKEGTNPEVSNDDSFSSNGLTSDQWQALVSLLNNVKLEATEKLSGECSLLPWIIDAGASHHMTGQLEYLTNVRSIPKCFVGLPNGVMKSLVEKLQSRTVEKCRL